MEKPERPRMSPELQALANECINELPAKLMDGLRDKMRVAVERKEDAAIMSAIAEPVAPNQKRLSQMWGLLGIVNPPTMQVSISGNTATITTVLAGPVEYGRRHA